MKPISTPLRGLFIALVFALSACAPAATPAPTAMTAPAAQAELSGMKDYLLEKTSWLKTSTGEVKAAADAYYALAEAAGFDYAALWAEQPAEVQRVIEEARAAWTTASPLYEQVEGIVAGTPSLADFDVVLDAGAAGSEDPEAAVPFDLTLPNGRVLPKPGNLFGVTESTLWGTYPEFQSGVAADWNGDGVVGFGEAMPDANVLKAGADALDANTAELQAAAQAWEPTESDAFTSLVVMVPTMSEYFNSWKNSRFVLGEASTQRDFVAISRLTDIINILGSLEVVYDGVEPLAVSADPAQAAQVEQGLVDLKAFVADVYAREQAEEVFTPEQADLLGAEAQNRATAIAGQVAQLAAQLGITLEE